MGLPKRRHSNQRTRTRRAHDFLTATSLAACANCGAPKLSHRICPSCGYYRGKQVITIKVKSKKEEKKS